MSSSQPLVLLCADPQRQAAAAALARQLNLPLIDSAQGHFYAWRLELSAQRLALHSPLSRSPVYADLGGSEIRRRVAAGRRQPLGRAFGLHRGGKPRVLDATAGLGRDSAVLAGLGCHVTLLERSPVLHAMLADTIASFGASCPLKLLACQDARHYWADHPERHDVVYLDPMYPERGKVALAKKEAQLLRALAGEDLDADALLAPAMDHALEWVVVKRHPKADWLAGRKPSHSLAGTRARYDVYLAK